MPVEKINYILSPKHTLIERVAAEMAAVFYEAGRSSGMTSKYKNPRSWARAHFERFIPRAVETLVSMLGRSDIAELQKQEIYDALMERHNDPTLCQVMPNNNIMDKMREQLPTNSAPPVIVNTKNWKITAH